MNTYINWSYDKINEMIAKCTMAMDTVPEGSGREMLSAMIDDLQDELHARMYRVSAR